MADTSPSRLAAKEALEQAQALLEIPALYFQSEEDKQSQAVFGMLMAAGLVLQSIKEGLIKGQL